MNPKLKIILRIAGIVALNLVAIILSLGFYYEYSRDLIRQTIGSSEMDFYLTGLIAILTFYAFFIFPQFRSFGIAYASTAASLLVFLVFFLNKVSATRGDYQRVAITWANRREDGCILNVHFHSFYWKSFSVDEALCLDVDSADVRLDRGLFWPVITDDISISESLSCDTYSPDSSNLIASYREIANSLENKRCFSQAQEIYNVLLQIDSTDANAYYDRGRMRLAKHEYHSALADFYGCMFLAANKADSTLVVSGELLITEIESIRNLINSEDMQLSDENLNAITDVLIKIEPFVHFNSARRKARYCLERIRAQKV